MVIIDPITTEEFNKLNDLLVRESGIFLKPEQDYLLEVRLTDLVREYECSNFSQFYNKVQIQRAEILPKMVDLMTTNETSWFRDASLWGCFEKDLLKNYFDLLIQKKKHFVHIWSAVCSTGQEVYSLRILINEMAKKLGQPELAGRFKILATDISASSLFLAKNGKYNFISMNRGLDKSRIEGNFDKVTEHSWKIKPVLSENVRFEQFNLKDNFAKHGKFDLILVRNVMIYFQDDFRIELLKKFRQSLVPSGVLILGASENIGRYSDEFEQVGSEGAVYYKAKS